MPIQEYILSAKQSELIGIFEKLVFDYKINLHLNEELPSGPYQESISVDIEHNEEGGFVGIGLYIPSLNHHYWFSIINDSLRRILPTLSLIAHNGISDLDILRFWGIEVKNEQLCHDTMLIGHITDSSLKSYGLKDMAKRELGIVYPSYDDIVGKRTTKQSIERLTLDKQSPRLVQCYNALDCYATYKLYELQKGQGVFLGSPFETPAIRYFNEVEKPLAPILANMSIRGVRVDLKYLKGLKEALEAQQAPIKASILNELGPINLNSPKQLLGALNAKEIYPMFKNKPSTDRRALQQHTSLPIVSALLQFSELDTLLSSFVQPYLDRNTEYIHPFFNQVGTRTGRLSCSNPNLLQIPRRTENGKRVRKMFIARPGMLLGDCDFGQIEPRLLAHLSKDPSLCSMFNDGVDFHTFTAEKLGINRERAKVLNLSVGYRATFKSVGSQLGVDQNDAQNQIDAWWALFPVLRRWQDKLIYESKRSGYCSTLFGRNIKVDGLDDYNKWKREAAERQLINNIAQASAREVMVMAMIKINQALPDLGLLVQVYDELVFEESEFYMESALGTVIECMEHAISLDVPLTVDAKVGANWASCH